MKKNVFSLIIAALLAFTVKGQSNPVEAINELKQGTLIVNLIVPTKKIETLLNKGNKGASIKLQKEVELEHKAIMLAFANNYNFSKVLFIYSYDMGKLADGDATALFDTQGNKQSAVPANYLFVELSETGTRNLKGFVVKDRFRDSLQKPFPYFVSRYSALRLHKRSFPTMVEKLQQGFIRFYADSVGKS